MYARWKTFVANVHANSTFVVATSQLQFVALSRGSAAVTHAVNFCCVVCAQQTLLLRSVRDTPTFVLCFWIAMQKLLLANVR